MRGSREGLEGRGRDREKRREWMELKRKKKETGEKVMDRETTINQNDAKEYLHSLLDAEEAINSNREAPEGEGRTSKREKDGRGRSNGQ
jgi:hypothetical protein